MYSAVDGKWRLKIEEASAERLNVILIFPGYDEEGRPCLERNWMSLSRNQAADLHIALNEWLTCLPDKV